VIFFFIAATLATASRISAARPASISLSSLGGIARVSQIQLMQLFFTLAASAWLLGETIDGRLLVYGMAVAAAAAYGARARIAQTMASSRAA
jgi:drug/metabolite transporter (DMT)-like permease